MEPEKSVSSELKAKVAWAGETLDRLRQEISKAVIGQTQMIDRLLIAILCDGHVLLEGVPGIAKTLVVNTLAKALQLHFKRIQFTPDLLPSDLIGTTIFHPKEGTFSVQKGPVFTNVVLADEINRAPPKVQSALLEVMQERQVTIAGETFKTETPFFVLGTQNPIEHEGTYPLPEAQTDRFMMKVLVNYPQKKEEMEVVLRVSQPSPPAIKAILSPADITELQNTARAIYLDEKILNYIVDIVMATRAPQELLEYGASPRASIYLAAGAKAHALMQARTYVIPFDVKAIAADILRHRLVLSYEAQAQEVTADKIIEQIFEKVPTP
ncbi:MAG: MoxR family ATPase [Verrucomicrobia bacterium]|nr:MoxR family ATPase [Verrucomicrobiota bacterium]